MSRKDEDLEYSPDPDKLPTLQEIRYQKELAEASRMSAMADSLARPRMRVKEEKFTIERAMSPKEAAADIALARTYILKHLLANLKEGLVTHYGLVATDMLNRLGTAQLQLAEFVGEVAAGAGDAFIIKEPEDYDKKLRKFAKVTSSVP